MRAFLRRLWWRVLDVFDPCPPDHDPDAWRMGYGIPSEEKQREIEESIYPPDFEEAYEPTEQQMRELREPQYANGLAKVPLFEQLECLDGPEGCAGSVEYRYTPDREDMKSFPRCEYHFEQRLDQAERNMELQSDVPPDWFDPSYAGESWDEP